MDLTLTLAIIGAITVSVEIMRFVEWLDKPRKNHVSL